MFANARVWARRHIAWDLCAALVAYVLVRALVLHTAFDEVGLWMYELYPMGTLAELIHRGVDFPLTFYYDNAAGQLFSGLAAVPVFALLGPTYLALKIVPFLLGVGTLLLAWRLLRAHFGRLAANLGAWGLVLAPTTWLKYSITCSGNHFENIFFSLLAITAFDHLHRAARTRGRLFWFGAAAGFALFIFLGAILPLVILAAIHLGLRGWRASLRDVPWLAAGFLVGELPLFALNLATGGRGLGFLFNKFGSEDTAAARAFESVGDELRTIGERTAHYLFERMPQAPTYPDALGVSGSTWNAVLYAVLALAWLAALPFALRAALNLVRGVRSATAEVLRWPLVLFVAYLPLSALAFALSNLRIGGYSGALGYGGFRYYLPWMLYGVLSSAALAGWAWQTRSRWRWPALLLPLGVIVPGLSNLALIDWSFGHTGLGVRYEGYDMPKLARGLLSARNQLTHAQQLEYLERFPDRLSAHVARGLGFNLAVLQIEANRKTAADSDGVWWVDLEALAGEWPERIQHELARGAGIGARFTQVVGGADIAGLLPAIQSSWERGSPRTRALFGNFLEGVAAPKTTLPLSDSSEFVTAATNGLFGLAMNAQLQRGLLAGLARGQGFVCGRLLRRGIPSDLDVIANRRNELPGEFRAAFHEGLGAGCAEGGEEPDGPGDFPMEPLRAPDFWRGYARELRVTYARSFTACLARLEARLPAEQLRQLRLALDAH